MSNTPNYDKKVKEILDATQPGEQTCKLTGEKWDMPQKEIEIYKKFNVPPIGYSPLSRHKITTAMWSGGQWWYNKHADTGVPIVAPVHPATGISVLPDEEWFARDFSETSQDLKLDTPFFDQIIELRKSVPSTAERNFEKTENSISVVSLGDVNSYFVVLCRSKNTFFSVSALDTESSAEVYNSNAITNSFQIIHCERIHSCHFARESRDCMDSAFLFDCRNCEKCFGATNKRNKKYLWFNEQLTAEEWERRRGEVDLGCRSVTQKYLSQFEDLVNKSVWPENFNIQSENCIGEYLTKATNCEYTYFSDGGAVGEYHTSWSLGKCENNAFTDSPPNSTDCYYSSDVHACHQANFCYLVARSQNMEYCLDCYDCENCFGCVGLRHKKFYILNKQYSEKEYWKTIDELKVNMLERGEYGHFLPAQVSPAWFPEGGSYRYYLADNKFGEKIDAHMFDPESEDAIGEGLMKAKETFDSEELPDCVDDLDDWVGKVLFDKNYNRRFALIAPEVTLYKELRIAPPTEHHVKRVVDQGHNSNTPVFTETECQQCSKKIIVSTNPKHPNRKIYCIPCYLKYIEQYG